jgi:hypothetical protein
MHALEGQVEHGFLSTPGFRAVWPQLAHTKAVLQEHCALAAELATLLWSTA